MIVRVFAVCLLFAVPAGALTLHLRDAEVSDRIVLLGDVAVISGVTRDSADSLARVSVGFSPMPGSSRSVPIETIRTRVLREGYLPGEVRLVAQAAPVVRRSGRRLDAELVERAVLEALSPLTNESTSLRITRIPATGFLPAGELRFSVEIPSRLERNFYVPVTVSVGEEQVKLQVSVAAVRLVSVVVPAHRVERGDLLGLADVTVRTIDAFDAPRGAYESTADVLGTAALRPLMPGIPLAAGMVQRPSVVQRGERVRLVSTFGALEVSVAAEAMEPGTLGQRIRVRNTESRRIVTARVRGAGEVFIDGE